MSTFQTVNTERSRNWIRHAWKFHWTRAFQRHRDNRLWVFSAWEGRKYADNARYLFEYVRKEHPDIDCIWQTKDEQVYRSLREKNIPVQIIGSEASRRTQKKAGVAVFTNGMDDFGYEGDVFGAILVCLWHGFGTKKGYRQLYIQPNPLKRWISNLKWDIFSWTKRDLTIVVSEYTKRQYTEMFRLKHPEDILIAGQARYDAFAQEKRLEDAFRSLEWTEKLKGKRILLYMPTFQPEAGPVIRRMEEIISSKDIRDVLQETNSVLVNKLHYLNRGSLESTETAIMLNDGDVKDVQSLLQVADVLITDYSSCAVDFSLLGKPILFFVPDIQKERPSLIAEMDDICSVNRAETTEELAACIRECIQDPSRGAAQSRKVRDYFCDTAVPVGKYAENNFRLIAQRLKEKTGFSL